MESKYKEKNTITVAELFANRDKYVGKSITIKGKVIKTSQGIIKRNWVHIEDGSRFSNMDDLVFTTTSTVPKVGDIVYASGIVIKDKDFGYGYFYPVLVEHASFKK
jgi:ABC-type antimicrobial peptide transport system ATPase subunit